MISFIKKNHTITRTAFYIFLAAGLFALPVYFSGEGTEEVVERMPGVSEAIIEQHEHLAAVALGVIAATAFIALIGLFLHNRQQWLRAFKVLSLLLAMGAAGLMGATAHLGGQIRHTEIRQGVLASSGQIAPDQNNQAESSTGDDD